MHNIPESGRMFLVKTTPENLALKHAFNAEMSQRTKKVRETSNRTAADVAEHLRVKPNTYYKYENSVAMPVYLIPRFLVFTSGNPAYLMGLSKSPHKADLHTVD